MKLYISHLFEDREMKELAEQYNIGIETIEFAIGYSLDKKEESIAQYEERMNPYLEKINLSGHGPFIDLNPASFDTQIKKVTMQRFNDAYDSIKRLHGEYIVFHTCLIPSVYFESSWRDNSILFWKEFFEEKDDSVKVYLENVYDNNPEPIISVIDAVDHPAFGFCLDIGHVNCFSERPLENWMDLMGNRIKHFHIHNNDGVKDQHKALDNGTIPMNKILDRIKAENPDAGWTLEINKFDDAVHSLKWLKENMSIQ